MESIAILKNAATRAIWGDEGAHQEPISGKTGDVSKGEPYDAGNMEPEEAQAKFTAPDETGTQPVEAAKATHTSTEQQPKPEPSPGIKASDVKDSSTVKGDGTKGQNGVRDPEDSSAHHDKADAKTNVDDTGDGLNLSNNKARIEGPGPRPLEEVAREHGGGAGKSGSDETLAHKSGDKSSEEDQYHHDAGTRELRVRSSGLVADGGNFDAAAPGAGREADRLMEEKGVHPNGGANGHANDHANDSAQHHKEKISLKTKIKAKLHRNSATASS